MSRMAAQSMSQCDKMSLFPGVDRGLFDQVIFGL
jgi:hypothetical protein